MTTLTTAMDRPAHGHDEAGRELSLADAALMLGLPKETIRSRARRGTLPARKRGGQWVVSVTAPTTATCPVNGHVTTGHTTVIDRPSGQTDYLEAATPAPADHVPTGVAPLAAPSLWERDIARLEAVNQTLQTELDRRAREVEQLHILLQRAQSVALPAPASPIGEHEQGTAIPKESPRRPWWRFWERDP